MVAYEWACRYPEEVAGLVLVNTSLGGLCPPWRRMRPAAAARVLSVFLSRDEAVRERRIFRLTSRRAELAENTVLAWTELARRQAVARMNALRQLVAAARFRARPLPAPVPVLLLASRRDDMVDPACSRAIAAALPGATLREHPDAGHDLPLDVPEWVLGAIAEWLPRRDRTKLLQI
jgi:pimeloyl-ACP methyl ester carboxylesterase